MAMASFVFEFIVAGLMVALIVYCVRLDRRLRALRENDSAIRSLIVELQQAAARAEATVGALKTAGLDAERSLNQAIRTAQAVEDDLLRRGRSLTPPVSVPASRPPVQAASAPAPSTTVSGAATAVRPTGKPAMPAAAMVAPNNRSEAERDLLRAIRVARAEGQG